MISRKESILYFKASTFIETIQKYYLDFGSTNCISFALVFVFCPVIGFGNFLCRYFVNL